MVKFYLATIILFLLIVPRLYAEEFDALFSLSLEELLNVNVTTASKYNEKQSDAPANIMVITRQQIRERGYLNVQDILQSLPGVDLQKYSVIGAYNKVSFRGALGNNTFLILQDGVRISSPAGETVPMGENFPLYYAKQVEILMGPASVVYGADAFMGVINIITMGDSDENIKELSLTTGTDDYLSGYAYLNHRFTNGVQFSVGIQGYRSQDLDFADGFSDLYNDSGKTYEFAPTKEYHFFANLQLNKNWQFGVNHSSLSHSNDFVAKPTFSVFDTGARRKIHLSTIFGRFNVDLTPNIHSSTLLTLMNYELDSSTYFNNNFTNGERGYKYADSDRISLNQDLKYKINDEHMFSGGLVYDFFDVIPRGPDLPSPYNTSQSPSNQNLFYPNTTLPIAFFDNDYQNVGGYLQDNWAINEKWRLVTGLRYDHSSLYGDTTNPRISLIYQRDQKNLIKMLYGQAFLAPAPDLAFNSFGTFTGAQNSNGEWLSSPVAPFTVPNADLKPEELQTLELNYEHWFDVKAHIKIAPFFTRISDVALSRQDDVPNQAIPGAELQRTITIDNTGDAEIYGVDFGVDYRMILGNVLLKNWASFSYLDGTLKNEGEKVELPMISKYKLKGGTTLIYKKNYILTPKFYWIGTTQSNQIDPDDRSKQRHVSSYFLMDLHAEAKITQQFSIQFDIYNLFDEKYSNGVFSPSFIAFTEAPQLGRVTAFTARFQF